MKRGATWLAVCAVAAVAILAVVNPFEGATDDGTSRQAAAEGERRGAESLEGPDVPLPGVLQGRLVYTTTEGCRPAVVHLDRPELGPLGPETGCRLAVAPDGSVAAVHADPDRSAGIPRIALVELDGRPTIAEPLGRSIGAAAWALDGTALAWCEENDTTRVLFYESARTEVLPGCDPHFSPDGLLLTRDLGPPSRQIAWGGEAYLDEALIEAVLPQATPSLVRITGYDVGASGLVVVVVSTAGPQDFAHVLQLWRGTTLEASILVGTLSRVALTEGAQFGGSSNRVVRLSPDEREVITGPVGAGARLLLIDLDTELETALPPQFGFDWSPDGAWLALSTSEEVLVLGVERSQPIYRLPIAANALAWRP